MKALYETKANSQAELKVTVDGETWKQAQEKAFKKIAANLQIKGFRKGHAQSYQLKCKWRLASLSGRSSE